MLPYSFIKHSMHNTDYFIGYFHLSDLLSTKIPMMSKADYEEYFKEPGTIKNRYLRYVKCNLGVAGAYNKLDRIMSNNDFCSVREATCKIDWQHVRIVDI